MSRVVVFTCLTIAAILGSTHHAMADGDDLSLRVTTKRDNDKVAVKVHKKHASISVHSPFGISHAKIERTGKDWPDAVTLRLHLKGLENFKVSNGKINLEATVSSHGDQPPVRQWRDHRKASPLNAKSPFWIEIRMVGRDGKTVKAPPLADGHFQIRLPKSLFKGNPQSITASWIDFYR